MLGGMSDPQQPSHQQHQVPPYASQPPAGQQHSSYQGGAQQSGAYQGGAQQASPAYVLNGQSAYAAQPPQRTGNAAGRAGLVIGLIGILFGVAMNIVVQFVARGSDGFAMVSLVSGFGVLISFALALTALILGLVGLRRRDAPLATAGIAAGIGVAGVIGITLNYLVNILLPYLLY